MIEINYTKCFQTNPVRFKDGATSQLNVIAEYSSSEMVKSDEAMAFIATRYQDDSFIRKNLEALAGRIDAVMESVNKEDIGEIFNDIANFDLQLYYDILAAARAMIVSRDTIESCKFVAEFLDAVLSEIQVADSKVNNDMYGSISYKEATDDIENQEVENTDMGMEGEATNE